MRKILFWGIHLLAGFLIFFFLLWHIFYMHYSSLATSIGFGTHYPLLFSEVVRRAKTNSFKIAYVLFLIFVLYHAFYGFKNILIETRFGKRFEIPLKILIILFATFLFIYGIFTTLKIGG